MKARALRSKLQNAESARQMKGRNSPFGRHAHFRPAVSMNENAHLFRAWLERTCANPRHEESTRARGTRGRKGDERMQLKLVYTYVYTRHATTHLTSRTAVATLNAPRTPVAFGRRCRRRAAEPPTLALYPLSQSFLVAP